MSLSLILVCLWAVVANVGAMVPSKRYHWPFAWVLIGVGIPILGLVVYQHGPWLGLIVLAAAMSILRWPVIYLLRRIRKLVRVHDADA
ncbi:DUF2484 family protein [Thalassovita taeanensis]|uniref:DUF2484 family protein n=1 Tax=Thalassovita taeanensis TaxID=657014 RepID=A0A1H9FGD6_9RHOB|nr:DUF2484 family protein [Thalassovita taeanensis]SEQ36997.1 Protein of unknown function [Thalassovita taeanensis]